MLLIFTEGHLNYTVCGRAQPASDALAKGPRGLEDPVPEEAIQLYIEACTILEDDGKEQMAFDLYRDVTSAYIKLHKHISVQFSYTCIFMMSSKQKNATTIASRSMLFWAMIMADVLVNFFPHTQKVILKKSNDLLSQAQFLILITWSSDSPGNCLQVMSVD